MKRHIIVSAVLLALAGLTFIQYRLLITGVKLEKQRFDQRAERAIHTVADTLNAPGIVSDALIARLKMEQMPRHDRDFLADTLDAMLSRELHRQGITARFTSVLTDKFEAKTILSSAHFQKADFTFNRYAVPLGSRVIGACHCETVLHLDIINLYTYLLGELDYLLIPSILCVLTIFLGLLLLVNTLRKEQKLNAVKNDFINNLTHELNTPAFSISLSAKLARENLVKGNMEKAAHFLQLIENENEKLKTHIGKVLELASLESPHYELRKEKLDLHPLIKSTAAEFKSRVDQRGGTLTLSLKADQSHVFGDAVHLKNVLHNLLDNALKYSPSHPAIELETINDGNGNFQLNVRDRGMGIALEHRERVFEKFYRVKESANSIKGFGLGLSYVFQVVKAHQGKVALKSNEDFGTVATVILPAINE